ATRGTRHQEVEIAHGLLAPAVAAGDDRLAHAPACLEIVEQRRRTLLGRGELDARGSGTPLGEPLEDARLDLLAEARQLGELARRRRLAELGETLDLELVEDELDAFRAEAGEGRHLDEGGRQLLRDLVEQAKVPALMELLDLPGQILADAGQLRERAARGEECRDAFGQGVDGARRIA